MKTVPIAFAFDNNLILPACVCLSSLLINAKDDTFYDIFILHSENIKFDKMQLDIISKTYENCRLQYRVVDNSFENAFEIRGITTATYYRLLIPQLIPEYDKIIYSDVDIIFRMDLSTMYNIELGNSYIAGTREIGMNFTPEGQKHINSMEDLSVGNYIQAGLIIINSKAIRENNIVMQFKSVAQQKLKFQDQDTLNIVCNNHIYFLSLEYNMTTYSYYYAICEPNKLESLFSKQIIEKALSIGNIHFNGNKPWQQYCINFDIWWEYYRKSPFYDDNFYFNFFYDKLDELDKLSFWKRIKTVIRYFTVGKK